jgi:hypothetical protein
MTSMARRVFRGFALLGSGIRFRRADKIGARRIGPSHWRKKRPARKTSVFPRRADIR